MNMTKVRSKSGQGIQLMLLGGTVYLRDGEETFLTEVHMTHNTVQTAIRNGDLIIIDEPTEGLAPKIVELVAEYLMELRRRGVPPAGGQPKVLGWDAAGEVVETGPNCTLFKPGDKVFYAGDITRSGCNAEYQHVDERIVGFQRLPVGIRIILAMNPADDFEYQDGETYAGPGAA